MVGKIFSDLIFTYFKIKIYDVLNKINIHLLNILNRLIKKTEITFEDRRVQNAAGKMDVSRVRQIRTVYNGIRRLGVGYVKHLLEYPPFVRS